MSKISEKEKRKNRWVKKESILFFFWPNLNFKLKNHHLFQALQRQSKEGKGHCWYVIWVQGHGIYLLALRVQQDPGVIFNLEWQVRTLTPLMSMRNTQTQKVSHEAKLMCVGHAQLSWGKWFLVMQITLLYEMCENTYEKIRFIVKSPGWKSISVHCLKMIQNFFLNQNNV